MIRLNLGGQKEIWTLYKITNTKNAKVYIGQTVRTLEKRWHSHVCEAQRNADSTIKLARAIRKHGAAFFTVEVLELCASPEAANAREIALIAQHDSIAQGYNISAGGGGALKVYCKWGHLLADTRISPGKCRECSRQEAESFRFTNPDKYLAKARASYYRTKVRRQDDPALDSAYRSSRRRAGAAYYRRQVASETPEEKEQRLAARRATRNPKAERAKTAANKLARAQQVAA